MLNKQSTNIEHIIAKIDNDFNIDHSDWIPRISVWVIEALSILKCTKFEEKSITVPVVDRIAKLDNIDLRTAKIYAPCGKLVESINEVMNCGGMINRIGRDEQVAIPIDPSKYPTDYVTTSRLKGNKCCSVFYYVKLPNNQIELNFDTTELTIKYKGVVTYKSEYYDCELPVIPNNGLLIEAIGYYCMYKILCRGHKHPVMNLSATQYGTNPFFMWNKLKDEAKRSVMLDEQGEVIDDGGMWQRSFFNFTFNPRG